MARHGADPGEVAGDKPAAPAVWNGGVDVAVHLGPSQGQRAGGGVESHAEAGVGPDLVEGAAKVGRPLACTTAWTSPLVSHAEVSGVSAATARAGFPGSTKARRGERDGEEQSGGATGHEQAPEGQPEGERGPG